MKTRGTRLVLVDGIDHLDNSELKTAFDYFGHLAAECNVHLSWRLVREATETT
ncbi:hypothetical protein [Streptomyces sp. NPDC097610]|uniref:hypothetical protein n=1 Tax=Streptomyces sp. NPDC097610 TaxID=3157227 RepID=UPI00332B385B